jgi:Flp pilus assembly protein TadB
MIGGGILIGLAIFIFVLTMWPGQRVNKGRLGIEQASLRERATQPINKVLGERRSGLSVQLSMAGISIDPASFVLLVGAVAFVLGLVGLLIHPLIGVSAFVLTAVVTRSVVATKARRRREAFTTQLPDVLKLITSSLKSGFGFIQSLGAVTEEADEPARGEFERVLTEQNLGMDLVASLSHLAMRMNSVDMGWMASAIDIQRDTGGNLSEVLENVAATIRERQTLQRQAKTLTAEGRLTAKVMTALPFVAGLFMALINPGYYSDMFSGQGKYALVLACLSILAGNFFIRRIVNAEV